MSDRAKKNLSLVKNDEQVENNLLKEVDSNQPSCSNNNIVLHNKNYHDKNQDSNLDGDFSSDDSIQDKNYVPDSTSSSFDDCSDTSSIENGKFYDFYNYISKQIIKSFFCII